MIYISQLIAEKKSLEKSISSSDRTQIKESTKHLEKMKRQLTQTLKKEQSNFKLHQEKIHKEYYPITQDILEKINAYSFNIQLFKLSPDYKKIKVKMEGSYQNLIRFIDFLGLIPAKVKLTDYEISLSPNHMMRISLSIEVDLIKVK